MTGKNKESISLLKLAEKENKKIGDKELEVYILSGLAVDYMSLGLYQQSIEYFKKTIPLSENLPVLNDRIALRNLSYANLISLYDEQKKPDSAFHYAKITFDGLKNTGNSTTMAYSYIYYKKNLDSAKYYLKYAEKVEGKITRSTLFEKYLLTRMWGEYYEQRKEYDSAQINYIKALDFAKEIQYPLDIQDMYLMLSKITKLTENKDLSNYYLQKYASITDSLSKVQKPQVEFSIQQYIKEKQEEYKDRESRIYYIVASVALLLLLTLLAFLRKKRKKEKLLEERLQKKRETIKEKEQETLDLKVKVNEGFEEVVRLAKSNSPEFVTRFKEVYPEFCEALTRVYPDINHDTLKFCALLKLNFSTKVISEYTYVTIRAVQIRKTRLRKKLNISTDEDIYHWITNLK